MGLDGLIACLAHTGWFATKAQSNIVAVNTADMCGRKIVRKLGVCAHPFEGVHHTILTQRLFEYLSICEVTYTRIAVSYTHLTLPTKA